MFSAAASRRAWGAPALIIGLIFAGAELARGQEECLDAVARAQAVRQREMVLAREFVAALQLSPAQARQLMPTIEKAADVYLEVHQKQVELMPMMLEAYGAFAEEGRLNQGFSEEVERRTARVHHREVQLRDEHARRLMALEAEVARVLTPAQQEIAEQFRPGQAGRHPAMAGRVVRGRQRSPSPQRQELAEARQALRGLRQQRHPRAGNLGRYLLEPAGLAAFCELARRSSSRVDRAVEIYERGTSEYPVAQREQDRTALAELRDTINNWNLINGLHLSQTQIERIVALFDAATPAPPSPQHRRPRPAGKMVLALERAVEEVLNPGQLHVLAEYQPCLIPPKNLRDPVRIGQASDHSGVERWLARVRRLSGKELTQAIDEALARQAERFGELSRAERRERRALLMRTVREASRLSDTEFELSRAELAARIAPPDREQELRETIDTFERELGRPGRIARMMLSPEFIEQLRQRGEQLAAGTVGAPVDLAGQPQAENCAPSCAINPKKPKSGTTGEHPDADK